MIDDHIRDRALKTWTHDGIECAMVVAPLGIGVNGYVRLPEGHPDRGKDYNDVDTIYEAAHMGLTYGSDENGWIGFDTLHFCDEWPADEMLRLIEPGTTEHVSFLTVNRVKAEVRQSQEMPASFEEFSHTWTLDRLRSVVNDLATEVASWMRMQEEIGMSQENGR